MIIGYVGNYNARHTTETHLAATLENLGHEVIRLQENQIKPDTLSGMIAQADWDLFLFTRTWDTLVTMQHLEQLKRRGIPSASYHLDLYIGLKRESGLDNDPFWRTDFVFTPDGDPVSQAVFDAKGINHFYMKPGVFEPECYAAPLDPKYGNVPPIDVLFVGGGAAAGEQPQYGHKEWSYRGQLIKFLKDTYGDRFTKKGWPEETVRNHELNQLYADTKVVVGDSLCPDFKKPYYWSDRIYETLGRGGFIIHPYIKGMEEEFTDGETIVFYEYGNWDQLKEKIDYYLEHDEERERILTAGHNFVKNYCTYTNRLARMIDIVFEGKQAVWGVPTPSPAASLPLKISLGAGTEPESGEEWVNVDILDLPGIDVVHNLMQYPWPFDDSCADYIKAKDLIEHLAPYVYTFDEIGHDIDSRSTIIAFIEECHRMLKPGGILWIQTPAWDADFLWIDPTHVRGFDERSFDFFDPDTDFGRATGFYSEARFKVSCQRLENGNLQFTMEKR